MLKMTMEYDCSQPPRGDIKGAGLLLFFRHHKKTWFVLAQDTWHRNSNRMWSGFEGASEPGETDEITASREFVEESMGAFRGLENIATVAQCLSTGDYLCKINVCIDDSDGKQSRYTTFLKEISADIFKHHTFQSRRRQLLILQRLEHSMRHMDQGAVQRLIAQHQKPLLATEPSAVTFDYGESGDLLKLRVNRAFMEKDEVRAWELSALEVAISRGGRLHTNSNFLGFIKPLFLPSISVATAIVRRATLGMDPPRGDLLIHRQPRSRNKRCTAPASHATSRAWRNDDAKEEYTRV